MVWNNKSRVGSQTVPSVITVLKLFPVIFWDSQFTFASFFPHLQSRRSMRVWLMLAQPWIPQRAKSYYYKAHWQLKYWQDIEISTQERVIIRMQIYFKKCFSEYVLPFASASVSPTKIQQCQYKFWLTVTDDTTILYSSIAWSVWSLVWALAN